MEPGEATESEPEPEPEPECAARLGCVVDYDARYRTGWAYGKKPNTFLVQATDAWLLPDPAHETQNAAQRLTSAGRPRRALSLGEGQGRNAVYLAERGFQCLAVDASTVGLDKARTLATQRGVSDSVHTCAADLSTFDPSATSDAGAARQQWDVILSIFCSLPAAVRVRLHRSCADCLVPGGLVIIECFAPTTPAATNKMAERETTKPPAFRTGPPESERVSHAQLIAEFPGLQVLFAREVTRTLNEGRFHRGVVTLTQFVARAPHAATATLTPSSRFLHYCQSIDAVFDEAKLHKQGQSDTEIATSAAEAYKVAAQHNIPETSDPKVDLDALLFCAKALLSVTCRAAVRGQICRYCWVPQTSCFCQRLAALSCGMQSAQAQVSNDRTVSQKPQLEGPAVDSGTLPASRSIRWVIISHPSEFLRSSSTARLAAALLAPTRSVTSSSAARDVGELFSSSGCELLVLGSASHEATLAEVVGSAVPPLVLFPLPPGQSEEPADALMQAVNSHDLCNMGASQEENSLTVLVPDGSWDCARAVVRKIIALRNSLTASDIAPRRPLRFVRLSDKLVAQHTSSIIDALRAGAGKGRLSTLEAMAMLPAEASAARDAVVGRASSSRSIGRSTEAERSRLHEPDVALFKVLNGQCADFHVCFSALAVLVSFIQAQNAVHSEPPEFIKVSPPPRYGVLLCCVRWHATEDHVVLVQCFSVSNQH